MLFYAAKYRKVTQINTESPGVVFAISVVPASLIIQLAGLIGFVYFSQSRRIREEISVFSSLLCCSISWCELLHSGYGVTGGSPG